MKPVTTFLMLLVMWTLGSYVLARAILEWWRGPLPPMAHIHPSMIIPMGQPCKSARQAIDTIKTDYWCSAIVIRHDRLVEIIGWEFILGNRYNFMDDIKLEDVETLYPEYVFQEEP